MVRGRSEKRTVGNEDGGRRERREKETLPIKKSTGGEIKRVCCADADHEGEPR